MRALIYSGPHQFSVREVARPTLGAGEVRLRVTRVGVCGTDVHLDGGGFHVRYPLIPGHEIVGEVVESASTSNLALGDRVVVENGVFCGACQACKGGRFLYCEAITAMGISLPGGLADELVVPVSKCYPVGAMSPDIAVLAEPLACVVHAMDRLRLRPGADVLVLGPGTAGQLLAVMARRNGAARVTVAGSSGVKLDLARRLGADHVVNVPRGSDALETAVRKVAPAGFDAVIDATGAVPMLESAVRLARIGGSVLMYGVAREDALLTVSPYEIFQRELTLLGSYAQALDMGRAVAYLQTFPPEAANLVTHRFTLDQYQQALSTLGSPDCVKAVVIPGGSDC